MDTRFHNAKSNTRGRDDARRYTRANSRSEFAVKVTTPKVSYIVDSVSDRNNFGRGEIIRITGFHDKRVDPTTQFEKFKDEVEWLGIHDVPRMLIRINKNGGKESWGGRGSKTNLGSRGSRSNRIEFTTDEELIYSLFQENLWSKLWLPETVVDWNGTTEYYYKRRFNYRFELSFRENRFAGCKAVVFVNKGLFLKDITIARRKKRHDFLYSYHVRGLTGGLIGGLRSEYITLARIDNAHGYDHIHFSELRRGGQMAIPAYDAQNIEVRVSLSYMRHMERKLKRIRDSNVSIIEVD